MFEFSKEQVIRVMSWNNYGVVEVETTKGYYTLYNNSAECRDTITRVLNRHPDYFIMEKDNLYRMKKSPTFYA